MPRNSSGTMSLPSPGVPFQSGQTISSAQVNATLTDLATEVSDSLSRSGKGPMLMPLRLPDGSMAVPSLAFTGEQASGLYRFGTNDVRLTIGGVDFITPNGIAFPGAGGFGPVLTTTVSGKSVTVQGNLTATSGAADVQIGTTATRTAGYIAVFQNPINTGNKLLVDYQGLLTLQTPAAAIQPAGIWTAITPDTNIASIGGPAYFKDASGVVHLKGGLTNNTGGATTTFVNTNPLPAGFRPISQRVFPGALSGIGAGSPVSITIGPGGVIATLQNVPNSITLSLDAVSFMAEQ